MRPSGNLKEQSKDLLEMPWISFVLKWLPFWCWMLRAVVVWMSVTYMDFQTLAYSGTAGALRTLLG